MKTLIIADSHSDFSGINSYCKDTYQHCKNILLLGDQEAEQDVKSELNSFENIYFIYGNHDETEDIIKNHESVSDNNLHCNVVEISGIRVAGIGGTVNFDFFGISPVDGIEDIYDVQSKYFSRDLYLQAKQGTEFENACKAISMASIFPADVEKFIDIGGADVLVSHEAPECHALGYRLIGDIGRILGVKLILHGHHHEAYQSTISDGNEGAISVVGVSPGCRHFLEDLYYSKTLCPKK